MAAPMRVCLSQSSIKYSRFSTSFRLPKFLNDRVYSRTLYNGVQFVNSHRNICYSAPIWTISSSRPSTCLTEPSKPSKLFVNYDQRVFLSDSNSSDTPGKEEGCDKSKKKESKWTGKNAWKLGLVCMTGMSVIGISVLLYEWGSPAIDKDGNIIPDQFSDLPTISQYFRRAQFAAEMYNKLIQEPSRLKLLPEPLKEPYYQPPYTLVIEMTGVLVNPEWTYSTGWRFKKRPGVEYFLQQVGYPQFEIVVYTAEQGFTAFPILDSLDPNGFIMYRLFRDATRYIKGHHVKDLDCLNRDLSKVIIIDHNPKSYQLHPRNALKLKKWKGDDSDRTLIDLIEFLRATVLSTGIDDVRSILEYYGQFDDPIQAFKENQRRVQEEREKALKLQAESDQKKSLTSGYTGWFGRRR